MLALAASTLAAGCGRGAEDPATLEFWAMGREGEVVQQLMPAFEQENPGVRVRVQQIPWTAAHEKLLTAFVGRATPDIAQLGNTWVPEFAAIGAIEPLDGWIAASAALGPDDYFPGIWDTNLVDGRVHGVPWYVDTRLLFYRSDLLAQAGWDRPPRTWDEWLRAMRDVKRHGADWAILLPTDEWDKLIMFALAAGAPLLRDGGRYGAFDEPRFRQAFEFYLGLFREGLAPPQARHQVANRYQQFAEGELAMYLTGPWDIGEFRRRLPPGLEDAWATAPLPAPEGVEPPGWSFAGGSSLVLFAASPRKELAWRLIEFLSRPEQQVRFYQLTGDLPSRRDAWNDPVLANDTKVRAFYTQLERTRALPAVPEIEEIMYETVEHSEAAVRGTVTPAQAVAAMDRAVDRILAKRRWLLARREPLP